MNVKDIRRHNLRGLSKQVGGITALSKCLKKPQSQMSHLIGIRPCKNVGDKMAAQIEEIFNKPPGWLDQQHHKKTGNAEKENFAGETSLSSVQWLPIIPWTELPTFLIHAKSILSDTYYCVPSHFKLSKESFVAKVNHSLLQKMIETVIPAEGLLIVDPEENAHKTTFVIAQEKGHNKKPIIHLISYETFQKQQEISENLQKPIIEYDKIIGAVKQILLIEMP